MPKLLKAAMIFTIIGLVLSVLFFISNLINIIVLNVASSSSPSGQLPGQAEGILDSSVFLANILISILLLWLGLSVLINSLTIRAIVKAKDSRSLVVWGVLGLFFLNWIGAILLLCVSDKTFDEENKETRKLNKFAQNYETDLSKFRNGTTSEKNIQKQDGENIEVVENVEVVNEDNK